MRKKKKRIISLSLICVFTYFFLAPIYSTVSYGAPSKAPILDSSAYAYLWLGTKEEVHHFLLFGRSRMQVTKVTRLVVRDEGENLSGIHIYDALVLVDGVESPLIDLRGRALELDRSVVNMHAGVEPRL